MTDLIDALRELRDLEARREKLVRAIWEHAKAAEPELVQVAAELWPGDQAAAAAWLSESRGDLSPAELIAAGRVDLVLNQIHRSIHGFFS
ncbi:MAG: hypothetical protein EPO46_10875 [Lysobacter sp.]|nr:MAG: hypothetical protein EPO46_10875 [Lysobacter sp.]